MNIVTVIQFVLKVFFSFSLSTVGTDHYKTYGGQGEVSKKYSREGKLNEKKFIRVLQLTLKKYLCYGLKNHTRNLITKKKSCSSKIPHTHFLMGRPLVMAKSTLERTVFSPPLTPKNIPLFSHDCSMSDTIYYIRQMKVT